MFFQDCLSWNGRGMVSSDSTRKHITVMIEVILRKINIVVKESVELLNFQKKSYTKKTNIIKKEKTEAHWNGGLPGYYHPFSSYRLYNQFYSVEYTTTTTTFTTTTTVVTT